MNMQLSNIQAIQILMEHQVFGVSIDPAFDACAALVEYLQQLEEDLGEEISLDPIALRCAYSMGTVQDLRDWYSFSDCTSKEDVLEYLEENTVVIEVGCDLYLIHEF